MWRMVERAPIQEVGNMCGSCHMLKTAVKGLHHHPGRYHGETKIGSIRFGLNDIAIALLAKSTNSGEKFVLIIL